MNKKKINKLFDLISKANFVYIIGNGGSAATSNHFACDLVKVGRKKAVSLCANEAIITAFANDNGYENVFVDQLKVFLKPSDLLITISGSGTSKNILNAQSCAKKLGAYVYAFPTMVDEKCDMREVENRHLVIVHKITSMLENG